eukprot:s1026_g21.t1
MHTVLDYKDGRCFNCSGKGHSKRECPVGKRSESREPRSESEDPKVAKATRVRQRSRERPGGPGKGSGENSEVPEGSVKIDTLKESTVKITPLPEEASRVVGEVNNLLKGLAGPMLKSVGSGGDQIEVDEGTGLLDGGATHPLRQGSTEEIKNAVQVTVELAHGATQLYQNPLNGTLLSETPVEPIVPLRGLVELGYTITWEKTLADSDAALLLKQVGLFIRGGEENVDESPHMAKMTSEEAWQAHIRQGHRPYRRDCRTCVLEMGARSPHRRRGDAMTSSWAMGVDIVGPFPKVRDLASGKDVVKYVMVATALVPDYITKPEGKGEDRLERTTRSTQAEGHRDAK